MAPARGRVQARARGRGRGRAQGRAKASRRSATRPWPTRAARGAVAARWCTRRGAVQVRTSGAGALRRSRFNQGWQAGCSLGCSQVGAGVRHWLHVAVLYLVVAERLHSDIDSTMCQAFIQAASAPTRTPRWQVAGAGQNEISSRMLLSFGLASTPCGAAGFSTFEEGALAGELHKGAGTALADVELTADDEAPPQHSHCWAEVRKRVPVRHAFRECSASRPWHDPD